MDEGARASETRPPGRSALRLCNLVAQSSRAAEGGLPAGGGEGTDGKGRGAVGADLLPLETPREAAAYRVIPDPSFRPSPAPHRTAIQRPYKDHTRTMRGRCAHD